MARFSARSVGSWAIIAATAIVLAGTVHLLIAQSDRDTPSGSVVPPASGSPPIPVRIETVRLQAIRYMFRYPAVVRPRIEADIGFRGGGKVVERFVDVATRVETGTKLARLEAALTKDGANPAVWVLNGAGDGIELRRVTDGTYANDAVTVMTGLSEGDRVVTAGVHKLTATGKIRIWTEPER